MMLSRTAKSRGPGAPTLALNLRKRTAGDGGKKARSPGRSRISRNTIVQGMPVDAVYPWLLTPVLFSAQAATGATRIRHSLRPLLWRAGLLGSNLARNRRRDREVVAADDDNAAGCLTVGSWLLCGSPVASRGAHHALGRHHPRMRMIQYCRGDSG